MVEQNEQPEEPQMPEQSNQKACATPDCSKLATMQCPTCIKLELPATYFCGQACFAGFWKFHKMTHKKDTEAAKGPAGTFTGPLRPAPYSFRGHREVPAEIKKPDYATTGAPNQHF